MAKRVFFLAFLLIFVLAFPARAVCPVCTIAVGAGLGLSRYLGIDDAVTGLWIGGLTLSIAMWTINWIAKKRITFFGNRTFIYFSYYAIVITPLFWKELIGHPYNKLWGVDKLMLGIAFGTIGFLTGDRLCCYLKKRNEGKAHFPFQKVAIPVLILLALSFVFYFTTK